ncbi:hypothetical protein [Streptomyces tendae]|uniref:hypothetical protein n=1 Tax=Streptomyces tendae TaxID=1932 RepID=UPI003446164A
MTPEMTFAVLAALLLLVPAAYVMYRAATTAPAEDCTAQDCRHCAALFGTPAGKAGEPR